ncbi:MAG: flagellin [Thaumarchaeota archaeon]|nr:flagellin [Nitrososphaerota archaeon]
MNLIRKGHGHAHRGVIGIESAIVLIAFVIVAAALAFVVLNMGFAVSQKAKTTIVSTLQEAGSSLEVSGKVIASAQVSASKLNVTGIPIKIAAGGDSVNLSNLTAAIKYLSNQITYDDIYAGTLNLDNTGISVFISLQAATTAAAIINTGDFAGLDEDPYLGGLDPDLDDFPLETTAFIYFTVRANENEIIEQGEHAVIGIVYAVGDRPGTLDKIRAELLIPAGASLTVERQVPNITTEIVDLG